MLRVAQHDIQVISTMATQSPRGRNQGSVADRFLHNCKKAGDQPVKLIAIHLNAKVFGFFSLRLINVWNNWNQLTRRWFERLKLFERSISLSR
jgi:hypothetical protein